MLLLVVDQSSQQHDVVRQSITNPCNGAQSSSVRIPTVVASQRRRCSYEINTASKTNGIWKFLPLKQENLFANHQCWCSIWILGLYVWLDIFWCNILPHPIAMVKFRPNHSVAALWILLGGSPVGSPAHMVVSGKNHQWSPRNPMEIIELNHSIRNNDNYHGVNLSLNSGKAFNSDWRGEFRRLPHSDNSLFFNSSLVDFWCRPIVTKGENYCWSKKILHPLRKIWNPDPQKWEFCGEPDFWNVSTRTVYIEDWYVLSKGLPRKYFEILFHRDAQIFAIQCDANIEIKRIRILGKVSLN